MALVLHTGKHGAVDECGHLMGNEGRETFTY